jgi:S1-C subfamily serine protease
MKKLIASPFVAAVLGGGVTAGALLGAGVVDDGNTTTVIQPAPIGSATRSASTAGEGMTARDIYKRDAPGVVFIRSQSVAPDDSPFDFFGGQQQQPSEATGSGFVIDDDGHIVTNAHVVNAATQVRVTFSDKRTRDAKIVGKDESTDLALLKVDPDDLDLKPLALGDSDQVQVGDPTIAIGNPFGFDRTLTTGVISAKQRRITAPDGYTIENVIQTDAAINPGNSGGPLIDAAGRVIGINSQIATGGGGNGSVGIGFAVPVNTAKQIVEQLKADGQVKRPWLGLDFVAVDESLSTLGLSAKSGMLVQQVVAESPADRAGIRGGSTQTMIDGNTIVLGGDVLLKIDGQPLKASEDVRRVLEKKEPGDRVTIELLREGRKQTVDVTLENRPAGKAIS